MITVAELMAGKRPQMPTPITPYSTAARATAPVEQLGFLGLVRQPLGAVSWRRVPVWLMWPCYRMGRCERSRLVIMPV